jgi:hypothetical protein
MKNKQYHEIDDIQRNSCSFLLFGCRCWTRNLIDTLGRMSLCSIFIFDSPILLDTLYGNNFYNLGNRLLEFGFIS